MESTESIESMVLDDDGNMVEEEDMALAKRKPGRPPFRNKNKLTQVQKDKLKGKSGALRKKTDVNSEEMKSVFKSLRKVAKNPNPYSIAELICGIVEADLKNQVPGEVVVRTQKSIETLNKISEDMIYTSGSVGMDDNVPDALDEVDVKQIESKDVTDVTNEIVNTLPEEDEIVEDLEMECEEMECESDRD